MELLGPDLLLFIDSHSSKLFGFLFVGRPQFKVSNEANSNTRLVVR